MAKPYLELIGVMVTHSKTVGRYRIDCIYQEKERGKLGVVVVQRGFDFVLWTPFERIQRALETAYAPAIMRMWLYESSHKRATYLQFVRSANPEKIGLGEGWQLFGEW